MVVAFATLAMVVKTAVQMYPVPMSVVAMASAIVESAHAILDSLERIAPQFLSARTIVAIRASACMGHAFATWATKEMIAQG